MVVAEEARAARAGAAILERGGNAVDAAVATAFVLAVTHPQAGNLGGGGFALVLRGGEVQALDFREAAPARAAAPDDDTLLGAAAVAVPGSVAGLWELHRRHGSLPWRELVAPAIALARDGFTVDADLHDTIAAHEDVLARNPAAARIFLPGGHAPAEGALLRNRDLAATLARIAARGAAEFYRGATARRIVAEVRRGGGPLARGDLAAYRAVWRPPIVVAYRGHRIYAPPLPSSGGVFLALAAGMLAGADLVALGRGSAAHVHLLAEVWRRAFAVRNRFLGDPEQAEVPLARLLAPGFARALAAGIDPARATPSPAARALVEGMHTTHLGVVDGQGGAVALTTTLNTNFGSGVVAGGAGFLLNGSMDDFAHGRPNVFGLEEAAANAAAPGKRMLSAMTPVIVVDAAGRPRLVAGAQGGPRILTAVWQVISNLLDFDLDVAAAVAAPRVHQQDLPDALLVEEGAVTPEVAAALAGLGHVLRPAGALGCATAIAREAEGWRGAADPRCGGLAAPAAAARSLRAVP